MADLEGQNAVITGGARGIGFSIAEQLLKTGVSKVLILDLGEQLDPTKQTNLMTCNPKVEVFYSQCDITDTQRLEKVLRQDAVQWMGSIDIFINCAGIVDENNPARCIATNLTALINCSMIAFDLMSKEKQGRGGTIVNISSLAGLEGFPCLAVYSASKSGVIGFTKSVGVEPVFKLTSVKVVAVCPGATETEMFSDSSEIELSFPALRPIIEQVIENMPIQKPIAVGRTVVKAITKGKTGSIWISVNDGFTEVKPNSNKYVWMMLFFSLKKLCCCFK
ncbi:AAEL017039-PA [Aedes aegypti]|uniref:AAEL017039-PA n=1 Tax=Aedes aegypti TaxID=7159 RepID=J9HJE4_AEDAE|nr:AAEL017039-PA [Aedes aegypti]